MSSESEELFDYTLLVVLRMPLTDCRSARAAQSKVEEALRKSGFTFRDSSVQVLTDVDHAALNLGRVLSSEIETSRCSCQER